MTRTRTAVKAALAGLTHVPRPATTQVVPTETRRCSTMVRSFTADDFHFPARDAGLAYTAAPAPVLIRRPPARVRQFARSETPALNRRMRSRMEDRWRWPTNPPVFETLSAVMRADDLAMGQRKMFLDGRILLSAAAGDRVWKSVLNTLDAEAEAALNEAFARERGRAFAGLPVADAAGDDLPFVLDMRNGYNFYHFLTELMPQLALVAEQPSGAPIHVHLPVRQALASFPAAFIDAVYPALRRRIRFTDQPHAYGPARIVYNHRHYLYQAGDAQVAEALAPLPPDDPWHALSSQRAARKFLLTSTYDSGMRLLRRHVLDRIGETGAGEGAPARIWIGRDPASPGTNPRENQGEEALLDALAERGFQTVYLERMPPLEQMATIARAEAIVAPHGAAFAHMLFARRDATVIEIATPQTQLHRWGDFLGNAHVAQCRYCTVFADTVEGGAEDEVPAITEGLKGIAIGPAARAQVLDLLDSFHADAPDHAAAGAPCSGEDPPPDPPRGPSHAP